MPWYQKKTKQKQTNKQKKQQQQQQKKNKNKKQQKTVVRLIPNELYILNWTELTPVVENRIFMIHALVRPTPCTQLPAEFRTKGEHVCVAHVTGASFFFFDFLSLSQMWLNTVHWLWSTRVRESVDT